MGKIDLMEMPIAIDLFPESAEKCVSLSLTGQDRRMLDTMTVSDVAAYVLENYQPGAMPDAIAGDIRRIYDECPVDSQKRVMFKVNGHTYSYDVDKVAKRIIADHTQSQFNTEVNFKRAQDPERNPFYLSEIRVSPVKLDILGARLEDRLYR